MQNPTEASLEEDQDPRRVLGANVYRTRVLKTPKMSQEELAKRAGVAENTIGALEVSRDPGKKAPAWPQLDTIQALAAALGTTISELFRPTPPFPGGWTAMPRPRHLTLVAAEGFSDGLARTGEHDRPISQGHPAQLVAVSRLASESNSAGRR